MIFPVPSVERGALTLPAAKFGDFAGVWANIPLRSAFDTFYCRSASQARDNYHIRNFWMLSRVARSAKNFDIIEIGSSAYIQRMGLDVMTVKVLGRAASLACSYLHLLIFDGRFYGMGAPANAALPFWMIFAPRNGNPCAFARAILHFCCPVLRPGKYYAASNTCGREYLGILARSQFVRALSGARVRGIPNVAIRSLKSFAACLTDKINTSASFYLSDFCGAH